MNKMLFKTIMLLCLSSLFVFANQNGSSIMKKVDSKKEPENVVSDMTMILINKRGGKRDRKIKLVREGKKKQIMWFLEPADVRGTSFLKIEKDNSDFDDMRLYLPAFKKIRRISSSSKGDKFMGSDFTYEDMTNRKYEDYSYTYIKDTVYQDKDCYVVESNPKKGAKTEYSKIISCVWKDEHIIVHERLYDKKSKLLKIKSVEDFKKIKSYQIMTKIIMENIKKRHKTKLIMENIKVDANIPSNIFHQRMLKRIPHNL